MTNLTIDQFFMGRREKYPLAYTPALLPAAMRTVAVVNDLITEGIAQGVHFQVNPSTASLLSSGWRPAEVNSKTPGAAVHSKHMTCEAADIYDPDGEVDDFCLSDAGQSVLKRLGLWMEHPSATKGWCHVQIVPPRSGNRVFYP